MFACLCQFSRECYCAMDVFARFVFHHMLCSALCLCVCAGRHVIRSCVFDVVKWFVGVEGADCHCGQTKDMRQRQLVRLGCSLYLAFVHVLNTFAQL